MIRVEFDWKEIERKALEIGAAADQIPFATALALNKAADITRAFLINATWPQAIQARNTSFIGASLTTKDARADKRSAAVEIYDRLDRGNLQMQAKGGTRTPRGGANLAVASSHITKGSRGVPARLRPKQLVNSFRKGDVVYVRDRRGRMKLMYVLKSKTPIPKRVPFYEDFGMSMQRELTRLLPMAVAKAMSTRR
jgi:hypothetical protein